MVDFGFKFIATLSFCLILVSFIVRDASWPDPKIAIVAEYVLMASLAATAACMVAIFVSLGWGV